MSVLPSLLSGSVLSSLAMMIGASASAELILDVDLGYSMPAASDYHNSLYGGAAIGYQSGAWVGQAGFIRLGKFEVENSGGDTHLTSRGPFLLVARTVETQWVDWTFGFGAARLESVATLQGYEFQSESSWEPLVEFGVHKSLSRRRTLTGGYTYYHNVVGSDVSALSLGIRWSF